MRQLFISRDEIMTVRTAKQCGVKAALDIIAPWACKYARVEGGYIVFECWNDYDTWRKQK